MLIYFLINYLRLKDYYNNNLKLKKFFNFLRPLTYLKS